MDTPHSTATLTILIDHADLAATYAPQHHGGPIDAHAYATEVVTRARIPYPFLDHVPAALILRLIPGLPEQVVTCRDGDAILDRTFAFLGLAGEDSEAPAPEVRERISIAAGQIYPDILDPAEYIVLEPHADPAHPGRLFVSWVTELIHGDVDDRTAGPWFGASPMASLCAALDWREQDSIGEPPPPEGVAGLSGSALADHVTDTLGLRHGGQESAVTTRQVYRPTDFFLPTSLHLQLILEPRAEASYPGCRFAAWAAVPGTPDLPVTRIFRGATPVAALIGLVDSLQQSLPDALPRAS